MYNMYMHNMYMYMSCQMHMFDMYMFDNMFDMYDPPGSGVSDYLFWLSGRVGM